MADADTETAEESAADSTATSRTEPSAAETTSEDDTADSADADTQGASDPDAPDSLVDEITDSLTEEGYDVFQGRELVSLRQTGEIAPNQAVCERYLADAKAVMLAYYKNTKTVAIIRLPKEYNKQGVYKLRWDGETAIVAATRFFKQHDIDTEQTIRYEPEWDEDITGDDLPGALLIDLRDDGETVSLNTDSEDTDES